MIFLTITHVFNFFKYGIHLFIETNVEKDENELKLVRIQTVHYILLYAKRKFKIEIWEKIANDLKLFSDT